MGDYTDNDSMLEDELASLPVAAASSGPQADDEDAVEEELKSVAVDDKLGQFIMICIGVMFFSVVTV